MTSPKLKIIGFSKKPDNGYCENLGVTPINPKCQLLLSLYNEYLAGAYPNEGERIELSNLRGVAITVEGESVKLVEGYYTSPYGIALNVRSQLKDYEVFLKKILGVLKNYWDGIRLVSAKSKLLQNPDAAIVTMIVISFYRICSESYDSNKRHQQYCELNTFIHNIVNQRDDKGELMFFADCKSQQQKSLAHTVTELADMVRTQINITRAQGRGRINESPLRLIMPKELREECVRANKLFPHSHEETRRSLDVRMHDVIFEVNQLLLEKASDTNSNGIITMMKYLHGKSEFTIDDAIYLIDTAKIKFPRKLSLFTFGGITKGRHPGVHEVYELLSEFEKPLMPQLQEPRYYEQYQKKILGIMEKLKKKLEDPATVLQFSEARALVV
jgi:hypothetical protein